MPWQYQSAFNDNTPVTATQLNQMQENLRYLRKKPSIVRFTLPSLTISNTTWASMGANYEVNITTAGGPILVWLTGSCRGIGGAAGQEIYLDIEFDGSRLGDTDTGLYVVAATAATSNYQTQTLIRLIPANAGTHTIKFMARKASTANLDFALGGALFVKEL